MEVTLMYLCLIQRSVDNEINEMTTFELMEMIIHDSIYVDLTAGSSCFLLRIFSNDGLSTALWLWVNYNWLKSIWRWYTSLNLLYLDFWQALWSSKFFIFLCVASNGSSETFLTMISCFRRFWKDGKVVCLRFQLRFLRNVLKHLHATSQIM